MNPVMHHMSSVLHHMGSLTDHMISVMRSHELSNASHDITISTRYMGIFWNGKIKLANLANRKPFKAVADSPVGPVLAGATFTQGKKQNSILHKASKSARVTFGLARLVIL